MSVSHVFHPAVYDCILPREKVATAEWCQTHLLMPPDSKIQGGYRLDLFPHFREPMNCFDDPNVSRITVQTASQIGKTVFAQACLVKTLACNPHPMAFADADERSLRRVMKRTWKLVANAAPLKDVCPRPHNRATDRIELPTCIIHGAWAGSSASAADYGAMVVVLNEADKMKHKSTDTEADFRYLMCERTKGYVGAKIIEISTPSLKDKSYIESQRLSGDNRRRMIPCPHCGGYQELFTGDGKTPGGLRFERPSDNSLDADLAKRTAWYECLHCEGRILERHRYEMCNAGIWVPEGCDVTDQGEITGTPTRPGAHASFGPLSTLHSLLPGVTLGVIAENWVKCLTAKDRRKKAIQNYINSWDGKTFDPRPRTITSTDIVHRMGIEAPLRICPKWCKFLTLSADVGRDDDANELWFCWGVIAWGDHSRGQLVDFSVCYSREEFTKLVKSLSYPHADGGPPLEPALMGVDAGDGISSGVVYDLCERLPNCWPLKGSSKDPEGFNRMGQSTTLEFYRGGFKSEKLAHVAKRKRRLQDYDLLIVNTDRTQQWIEDRLSGLVKPQEPEWFSFPTECLRGQVVANIDLPRHLQGDYQNDQGHWRKRWEDQEMRDVIRYGRVLAEKYTDNGANWDSLAPRILPGDRPQRDDDEDSRRFINPDGAGFSW